MQELRQGIRQMGMSRCNLNIMAATTASWLEPGAGDIKLGESVTGMTNPLLFQHWSQLIILAYECCVSILTSTLFQKYCKVWTQYSTLIIVSLTIHFTTTARPSDMHGVEWHEEEGGPRGLKEQGRQGRSHHTNIITVIDIIVRL